MGAQEISREVLETKSAIVKVLWPDDSVNGTGFFCHPDGFVLTCRHVVDQVLKQAKDHLVALVWENREGETIRRKAQFLPEFSPERSDLAILKVVEERTPPYTFLPLDAHWRARCDHKLDSFGYPQGAKWSLAGIPIKGNLVSLNPTKLENVPGLEGVELCVLDGFVMTNVKGGFSGAPILDRTTHKVIGLVSANDTNPHQAFMAPLKPLFECWESLRDFYDIPALIRKSVLDEAKLEFDSKLGQTPWVTLELDRGVLPRDDGEKKQAGRHGRLWKALDPKRLLALCDDNVLSILSADAGTGKTTLLRWLCCEFLKKTKDVLPIFLTCEEARELDKFAGLRSQWIEKHRIRKNNEPLLVEDLAYTFDKSRIFLLCDALDQVRASNFDYASVAQQVAETGAKAVSAAEAARSACVSRLASLLTISLCIARQRAR